MRDRKTARRPLTGRALPFALAFALAASGSLLSGSALAQDGAATVPEIEESDIATLPDPSLRWAFLTDGWSLGGTRIIDGDTGKIKGIVQNGALSDFVKDPSGKYYYVVESIWSKGNRGTRQDLLTIYDAHTLKIAGEIALPGRLLIGNRLYNLVIGSGGKYAFIYNMDPASSVVIVDLQKKKYVRSVEIPGCGLIFPAPDGSTSSLCSDGSMTTVKYDAKMAGTLTQSPVFFSAENDPIFDNSFIDTTTGKALFLTYTGLIYETQLGAKPVIGTPWSIQEAAGVPAGSTKPLIANWLPGGREPIAYHRDSGKAYVLMHMGEYWSQKVPGSELWEIDVAAKKVLRRTKIEGADNVVITQGADPLIFLNSGEGKLVVLDAKTMEQKHELSSVGTGNLAVVGN